MPRAAAKDHVARRAGVEPPGPAARRPPSPAEQVLQLQRSAGNAAVSRALLARRFDRRAYESSIAEKEKFRAWVWGGPRWRPSTRIGNFDALYEPKAGELTITVKCKFWFADGKQSDFTDADPSELVWEPAAILKWKADFTRRVSAFWSDRFTFHCTRDWWEDLQAVVKVRFVESDEKDAHYVVNVKKIPEGEYRKSRVRAPKHNARQGKVFLDSEDLTSDGQTPIYHESGHMLGLGDEYPNKKNRQHGVAHGKLVQKDFGHGVERKRDDRLMSNGDRLLQEYGVTMLEALRVITGIDEWSYKQKPPAAVLSEPVDGPLPAKPDPLATGKPVVAHA